MGDLTELNDREISRVLSLWMELSGERSAEVALHRLQDLPDRTGLLDADDALLRTAAAACRGSLTFTRWARQVRVLLGIPEEALLSPPWEPPLTRVADDVERAFAAAQRERFSRDLPADVVESAWERIRERAAAGTYERGWLLRRQAKWRRIPGRTMSHPPTVDGDDVELAIARLLAITQPVAQYAADTQGRAFAGHLNGYHREKHKRFYVTGLSDVVDTIGDVVQEHRGAGRGGRFYVHKTCVECPECGSVIAWLREPTDARSRARSH